VIALREFFRAKDSRQGCHLPHSAWKEEIMEKARFSLGRLVATPGSLAALQGAGQNALEFLSRHQHGDWGDLDEEDKQENERSIINGSRIFSAYVLNTGVRIWAITEADRSATTILLPKEY
jgi:hypothetical protein